MKAEGPARHATYVPHPEASSYTNYLLTLLAQRRELQSGPLCHALNAGGSSSLPPHIFMAPATAAHVDRERAALQHEVCLQPQAAGVGAPAASISPATALTDAVQRVASPLAGAGLPAWRWSSRSCSATWQRCMPHTCSTGQLMPCSGHGFPHRG
ncbi:uncharacterized protein HaLaN_27933, partial [Haematococcus lacustris]